MFAKFLLGYVCCQPKAELKGSCKNNFLRSALGAVLWKLKKDGHTVFKCFFEGRLAEAVGIKDRLAFFSPECSVEKTEFQKGEKLTFQLLLLCPGVCWELFVPALRTMLEQKGFILAGIWAMPEVPLICQPERWQLVADSSRQAEVVPEFAITDIVANYRTNQPVSELAIELATPVRLERGGELVKEPSFADIVFACFRRVENIYNLFFFGQEKPPEELAVLPEASLGIQSAGAMEWRDWYRKTKKQEEPMVMGGAIGTINVFCDKPPYLNPFLGLLKAGEILHIGKGITMGNGLIRVRW